MKDTIEAQNYLADTYAIIEIIKGNPNYKPFINSRLFTTKFNLTELYYSLLRDFNEVIAEHYFQIYSKLLIPVSFNCIRNAMKFKLLHYKEKLSYTDCIGHALAAEQSIQFLTGDQKFEKKLNVEFVK